APAGPAPTTITSTSGIRALLLGGEQTDGKLVEDGVGVADDREIGELHHRAVAVDVDADDVVGLAEAARVLHRAADRKGDVQRRVDDDTGRPDLALVADPALVRDDPGGAQRSAEGGCDGSELPESARGIEAGAPSNDALGLAEVHARCVRSQQVELGDVDG